MTAKHQSPFIVVFFLLGLASQATAQSDTASLEDDISPWLEARVNNAKAGQSEIVRIPLALASPGWGCDCPREYIGISSVTEGSGWLDIKTAPGVSLPTSEERGFELIAEGVFTGKTSNYEAYGGEQIYKLLQFEVHRFRPLRDSDPFHVQVLLSGAAAASKITPFSDDRRWLVMAGSVSLTAKNGAAQAEKIRQKLVRAGFADAEVFDSRRARKLFCCHHVIVAGRFKTRAEASARAKAVRAKTSIRANPREGW